MLVCCIKNCQNTNQTCMIHTLPLDESLKLKWLTAIQRLDLIDKPRRSYGVCDEHFSDDQKFVGVRSRTNLIRGSVPNINLPEITNETLPEDNKTFSPPEPVPIDLENENINRFRPCRTRNEDFLAGFEPISISFQDPLSSTCTVISFEENEVS